MSRARPVAERFWRKVDKNGPIPAARPELGPCWLWRGLLNPKGYGRFAFDAEEVRLAHRVAFLLTQGREPNLSVLHKCDVRRCCRPDHLFEGTQAENIRDCITKGRLARGTRMPHAKLTDADVRVIRAAAQRGGESQAKLALRFSVSRRLIQEVVKRRRWAHVEDQCET